MPENPLEQARFDHVDATGRLVFAVGNLRFAVSVDETLERAILEAKQIRSESNPTQPRTTETLPISQIQSLIRAGVEPSRVAERYGLGEALVRRFSASVETEKQYAIEQFLTVPAPKESRMRTIAELIESTLATARIGMETLSWRATRRGLEPWRITAQFRSSGRQIKAEWTWNMHDNSISCVNSAAKKLLGEQMLGSKSEQANGSPATEDGFSIALNLPGDSIRSARIERAVSQWSTLASGQDESAAPNAGDADDADSQAAPQSETQPETTRPETSTNGSFALERLTEGLSTDAAQNTSLPITTPQNGEPETPPASAPASDGHPAKPREQTTPENKRKSGRSAVPSWDEILFGN